MSLPTRITLPVAEAAAGGLIQSTRGLPDGWERGVTFYSGQCLVPERIGPCPVPDSPPETQLEYPTPASPSEAATFLPVLIRQGLFCSTMSPPGLETLAGDAVSVTREYALALELVDGLGGENPSLSGSATLIGDSATVPEAIACLEASIAASLAGRVGFLHVPPELSTALPGTIYLDGQGRWRTVAGNVIIVSPGYTTQTGDTATIYASGEVFTAVGFGASSLKTNRETNTDEAWADELGIAVFDPCYVASVTTDYTACAVTSP